MRRAIDFCTVSCEIIKRNAIHIKSFDPKMPEHCSDNGAMGRGRFMMTRCAACWLIEISIKFISMNEPSTILLVEDNPDDEALTVRALKKSKVKNEVIVVRDGAEALDFLFARGQYSSRNTNNLPQVMLLDLKLPKVDGLEVLRQVRADTRTKLLPIVILTSSKEERDLMEGYSNGCNSYIVKPVDMAQFTEAVQALELYWVLLNEKVPGRR